MLNVSSAHFFKKETLVKVFQTRGKIPTKTGTEPPNFTEKLFRLRNQIVFISFIQFNFIHVDFNHFTIT